MPGLQCTGNKSSNHTATQMFLNMHINGHKALEHGKSYIFLPFSVCALIGTVTFGGQRPTKYCFFTANTASIFL